MAKLKGPKRQRFREDECKVDRISRLPDKVLVSILALLSLKEATATSILGRRWRYLHTWIRNLVFDVTEKVDRISRLPDKILVSILALLSLKEATATSILGRRWRYLHTWIHNPVFDVTEKVGKNNITQNLDEGKYKLNEWIEGFVDKDMSSEEFIDVLNPNTRTTIISIRVEKRVLKLTYADSHNFPYHAVVGGDEFKCLKKLSLNDMSIKGEFVKEVMQSNRFLQHLSLTGADVTEVEIIDPSPFFKCLEISLCHNIGSLVIRNSNIVTLKLMTAVRMEVVLENVPNLVEFCCWPDALTVSMEDFREMFSSVFPQLRRLKLYILFWHLDKKDTIKFSGVDLSNLIELVVVDDGLRKEGGLMEEGVFDLINASHKLEKFVLVSPEDFSSIPNSNPHPRKAARARRAGKKIPKKYPCLKEMDIVGYHGLHHEFEMIMHLIENGVALQNIVVDTRSVTFHSEKVHSRHGSYSFTNLWDYIPKQNIRSENAYELIKYVPSRINLTIL